MDKKLKIALCISGLVRNYEHTFHNFKKYLLDKYDCDIFIYGVENIYGVEKNIKDLINFFKPKKIIINDINFYKNIERSSFYNVLECNKLKKEYEKKNNFIYDFVIRLRFDYFFYRDINLYEYNKDILYIPIEWSFKEVDINCLSDIFCIGGSKIMDKYSDCYNFNTNIKFHPETFIGYYIKENNIPYILEKRYITFEYPCERNNIYIFPYTHYFNYNFYEDITEQEKYLYKISLKRKEYDKLIIKVD